jgi:HEAT repeat protein
MSVTAHSKTRSPLERVVAMLHDPRIERRCAAAMVLGELHDRSAVPALCEALRDDTPVLQTYLLDALDTLGARTQAAKHVLPLLDSPAPEVRARAAAMLASSGAQAAAALKRELAPEVPLVRRRAVVQVLAQQRSPAAIDALLETFADPALAELSLQALRAELDRIDDKERRALAERAEAYLQREKSAPQVAACALRLLGYLGDPASIKSLLAHATTKHVAEVRAAALAGLRRPLAHTGHKTIDREVCGKLLGYADDEDDKVAREALGTLTGLVLPEAATQRLLELASASRHADTRRFAIERVGQADVGAREASALIAELSSTDPTVRDAAGRSLAKLEAAAGPLAKALIAADTVEQVRRLAGILRAHAVKLAPAQTEVVAQRALDLLAQGDAMAEDLLEAFWHLDPALYARRLGERAAKLRKAKKTAEAWPLCKRIARAGGPIEDDTRWLIATVGILVCGKSARNKLRLCGLEDE